MNTLNQAQEQLIEEFTFELSMIDSPDDMFPPDNLGGVREPRRPIMPSGTESDSVTLAAVYDLCAMRKKRGRLKTQGAVLLHSIDLVLS